MGEASTGTAPNRASTTPLWARWLLLLAVSAGFVWGWDSFLMLPLRLIVVTSHELGHAVAALLTGGQVVEMTIDVNGGGRTVTLGGDRIIILNGGYLGSMIVGLVLLLVLRTPGGARTGAGLLGAVLAFVALRWLGTSTVAFSVVLVAAVILLGLATRSPPMLVEWVVRIVGWFGLFYAVLDIRQDVFATGGPAVTSDAMALQLATGTPASFWGASWLLAGLVMVVVFRRQVV